MPTNQQKLLDVINFFVVKDIFSLNANVGFFVELPSDHLTIILTTAMRPI